MCVNGVSTTPLQPNLTSFFVTMSTISFSSSPSSFGNKVFWIKVGKQKQSKNAQMANRMYTSVPLSRFTSGGIKMRDFPSPRFGSRNFFEFRLEFCFDVYFSTSVSISSRSFGLRSKTFSLPRLGSRSLLWKPVIENDTTNRTDLNVSLKRLNGRLIFLLVILLWDIVSSESGYSLLNDGG